MLFSKTLPPQMPLTFLGSFIVGIRNIKYQIKLFKLMNWRC